MTRPARQPSPPGAAALSARPTGPAAGGAGGGSDPRRERDERLAVLLAAAAAGDAAAFERFYEATFAFARTVARRLLRDNAEVEDLLADCYFEAWRTASRFDGGRGSAVTWLLTLVRSRGLDALRAAAARPERAGAAPPSGPDETGDGLERPSAHADGPVDAADPAERLWRREAGAELHAALSGLTGPERWVLGLAYLRELSHAEIARCTGMPLGTVKSHVLRAQQKLRTRLSLAAAHDAGEARAASTRP